VNHPNGLMDPLLLLCLSPRPVSFLAKSPLFTMPFVSLFVKAFDSIPVYRPQDADADVRDFIEWAFNSGHIDKENYVEHSNTVLDQYKTSVEAYQDKFMGIDAFAQKYGLVDFKLGINRLKQGAVQIRDNTNTVNYYLFYFILF